MAYGLEADVINDNNIEELEKAHRHHAKIVQGIPNMVHKPAVLAPLGGLSMKGYIAIKKMFFYGPSFVIRTRVYTRQLLYEYSTNAMLMMGMWDGHQ